MGAIRDSDFGPSANSELPRAILICSSYRLVSTIGNRESGHRERRESWETRPGEGCIPAGIGRTGIIQEVSAAAPLRIPCDVFNGRVSGGDLNQCLVLMQKVPVTRAPRQRGISNEELPISLETPGSSGDRPIRSAAWPKAPFAFDGGKERTYGESSARRRV